MWIYTPGVLPVKAQYPTAAYAHKVVADMIVNSAPSNDLYIDYVRQNDIINVFKALHLNSKIADAL